MTGARMPVILCAVRSTADLDPGAVAGSATLLADLVAAGAALGWVDPPRLEEVRALLVSVADAVRIDDAALVLARDETTYDVLGLGYWRRYARPTHRPHADLERVAVRTDQQGRGLGRRLTCALVEQARRVGVEQLTLDLRGDNTAALRLYQSLGFRVYGRLADFVAVGAARYEKVFCARDLRDPAAPPEVTTR